MRYLSRLTSRGDRRNSDVSDRQSGNGRPQRVSRREDTVVPMSVFSWRRDQVREAIDKLMRREGHHTLRPLATVVIGEIVTSTIPTAFVVPAIYPWFATGHRPPNS